MSNYQCPKCGEREFEIPVQQYVKVQFYEEPNEDGDDHQVYQGPDGDMEWDGDSYSRCINCDHWAPLKEMVKPPEL
jgi:hypothetical protein